MNNIILYVTLLELFIHILAYPTLPNIDLGTFNKNSGILWKNSNSLLTSVSASPAGDFNQDGIDDIMILAGQQTIYVVYGNQNGLPDIFSSPLSPSQGFTITGTLISSLSNAGDINNDGADDLVIGQNNGGFNGSVYVIFGNPNGSSNIDLKNFPIDKGFIITGDSKDALGTSVSSIRDFNGDNIADIVIGAPSGKKAYVIYGSNATAFNNINIQNIDSSQGLMITGGSQFDFGSSVSTLGDTNGDGYDDIVIAAMNGAYIIFGGQNMSAQLDVTQSSNSQGFIMIINDGHSNLPNHFIRSAGDINADGFDDIIVGSQDLITRNVYIILGRTDIGSVGTVTLTTLDPTIGFKISESNGALEGFGTFVTGIGDINNDNIDDIIITAPTAGSLLNKAGMAYIIYGNKNFPFPTAFTVDNTNNQQGFQIKGADAQNLGLANTMIWTNCAGNAGDINGDGLDDLFITAPGGIVVPKGAIYLIYGRCPTNQIVSGGPCFNCSEGCEQCMNRNTCTKCSDQFTQQGSICVANIQEPQNSENVSNPQTPTNSSESQSPQNASNPQIPTNSSESQNPQNDSNPQTPTNSSESQSPQNISNPQIPTNSSESQNPQNTSNPQLPMNSSNSSSPINSSNIPDLSNLQNPLSPQGPQDSYMGTFIKIGAGLLLLMSICVCVKWRKNRNIAKREAAQLDGSSYAYLSALGTTDLSISQEEYERESLIH